MPLGYSTGSESGLIGLQQLCYKTDNVHTLILPELLTNNNGNYSIGRSNVPFGRDVPFLSVPTEMRMNRNVPLAVVRLRSFYLGCPFGVRDSNAVLSF